MSEPARPRPIDVAALALFGLLWLVPMAWVGFRGGSPERWPTQARDFYSVSCLFGTASERVSVFYVQVRRDGRSGWEDFDESEYFQLEPFGHRTRFDRFMARFGYQPDSELARAELARWLAVADRARHPELPRILAVRFVWGDVVIAEQPPTGRWHKPPRSEFARVRRLGDIHYLEPDQPEASP